MPNCILPLLGGLFIDAIGIRIAMVGFFAILIVGQCTLYNNISFVLFIGSYRQFHYHVNWKIYFRIRRGKLCRCIILYCKQMVLWKWISSCFRVYLNCLYRLNITFARLGSVLGALLLSRTYTWFGDSLSASMFFCLALLLLAWGDSIGLAILDKASDKRD
jgi:hypothetical protein